MPDLKGAGVNELHLFAGAGGGILGGMLLGHTCVCAVEIEPYCQQVLLQRQRDGILPRFPIWDDVRTFDGRPWRGHVDVVAGGFPCKGISPAGDGDGLEHPETGLWSDMARAIREVGPRFVFVENSPLLTVRGIERVLGDLAALGYDAQWGVLGACDAAWSSGTPIADHERFRIWIFAVSNTESERRREEREFRHAEPAKWIGGFREEIPNALRIRRGQMESHDGREAEGKGATLKTMQRIAVGARGTSWWATEPGVYGVAHGVADRVDRLRAIGNGQVPAVAALAWQILSGGGMNPSQPSTKNAQPT